MGEAGADRCGPGWSLMQTEALAASGRQPQLFLAPPTRSCGFLFISSQPPALAPVELQKGDE